MLSDSVDVGWALKMRTCNRFSGMLVLVGAHLEKPCFGVPSHDSNIREN